MCLSQSQDAFDDSWTSCRVKVGEMTVLSHDGLCGGKCTSYTEESRNNNQVKAILGHHLELQVELPGTTGTGGGWGRESGNSNMSE